MGTTTAARGTVEANRGSTDWDEHSPDACGEKGDFYSGLRPQTTAPGAALGLSVAPPWLEPGPF
jgi:hypothetical protein